jgi:hypothetical protein
MMSRTGLLALCLFLVAPSISGSPSRFFRHPKAPFNPRLLCSGKNRNWRSPLRELYSS